MVRQIETLDLEGVYLLSNKRGSVWAIEYTFCMHVCACMRMLYHVRIILQFKNYVSLGNRLCWRQIHLVQYFWTCSLVFLWVFSSDLFA